MRFRLFLAAVLVFTCAPAWSQQKASGCGDLPDYNQLKGALTAVVKEGK